MANRMIEGPAKGTFKVRISKIDGRGTMQVDGVKCPELGTKIRTPEGDFLIIRTIGLIENPKRWNAELRKVYED